MTSAAVDRSCTPRHDDGGHRGAVPGIECFEKRNECAAGQRLGKACGGHCLSGDAHRRSCATENEEANGGHCVWDTRSHWSLLTGVSFWLAHPSAARQYVTLRTATPLSAARVSIRGSAARRCGLGSRRVRWPKQELRREMGGAHRDHDGVDCDACGAARAPRRLG